MQRLIAPITQALALYPSLHVPPSLQAQYSTVLAVTQALTPRDMALPLEGIYSSKDALLRAIND